MNLMKIDKVVRVVGQVEGVNAKRLKMKLVNSLKKSLGKMKNNRSTTT